MSLAYEIIVQGNNLRLKDDFLGMSNVTLIRAASEWILFDTGGYIARLSLLKKLRERGLEPKDIGIVFLSHLHFDHAHNVDLFPDARFVVSRREWDYVAAPNEQDVLIPWGIRDQLSRGRLELVDGEGELVPGITYFPAPGHTPGCYALRFTAENGDCVVIAGDAIKYVKEAILARCDMAFDTLEAGTATIRHILDIADRIVPGHFPELIRQPNGSFYWEAEAPFNLLVR